VHERPTEVQLFYHLQLHEWRNSLFTIVWVKTFFHSQLNEWSFFLIHNCLIEDIFKIEWRCFVSSNLYDWGYSLIYSCRSEYIFSFTNVRVDWPKCEYMIKKQLSCHALSSPSCSSYFSIRPAHRSFILLIWKKAQLKMGLIWVYAKGAGWDWPELYSLFP
jgi:hypothetical protein